MRTELSRALGAMFTPAELLVEVLEPLESVPGGDGLCHAVPDPGATPALIWFSAAVGAMDRRGLISREALFAALLAARPARAREIHALAEDLRRPAPERQVIEEDPEGAEVQLRCLSWRLYRPARWRLDLPVAVLLDRLRPDDGFGRPVALLGDIRGQMSVHLEHGGRRLDPALGLAAQGVAAGDELGVVLELGVDAPHQERQVILLRAEEEEALEAILEALGFRLEL